jgi:DNA-binding NtrC family response regulator
MTRPRKPTNEVVMGSILVADDNEELCKVLQSELTEVGHNVVTVTDGTEAVKRIKKDGFDLLLTDLRIPGFDGIEILKETKEHSPSTTVIIMTAFGTIESAVEAMRLGAFDYVVKPFTTEELEIKIARALEDQRLDLENKLLKEEIQSHFGPMVGGGKRMRGIYELVEKVAPTAVPVLITGKSGTGKELVAREIHNRSDRKDKPFIAVNCAALASGVLESELFGHERGSFTGAVGRRKGKFEIAHGGTLFLDEIGELSDEVQVKLLRFLQEKEFQRVGGNENIRVDVRVIAATNQDLQKRIADGQFREDLFYRLNMFSIAMPPLSERGDDIYDLIAHFVAKYNSEFRKDVTASPEVLDVLKQYPWPGNIRELENVIAQAVILAEGNNLELRHLPFVVTQHAGEIVARDEESSGEHKNLSTRLEKMEAKSIAMALEKAGGNQTKAAKALGIKRSSLQYKMQKYGLSPKTIKEG